MSAVHHPRYHAVSSRLPRLPRELVHEVFNDLWLLKILEILCNHPNPYLTSCASSHFKISQFLPPSKLQDTIESFTLYLRICALHRANPHPYIPALEHDASFYLERMKQGRGVDVEWEIRNAIVAELDKYTPFIPTLNFVVPDQIIPWGSPAFRDVSRGGLKEAFDLIDSAEVKLNTLKANQLRRLANLLEMYPNYLRTCCEKNGELAAIGGAQKHQHRVAHLRTLADKMSFRQILDGRFVARTIFAQNQFYLIPHDRVIRMFVKVLYRFPPAEREVSDQDQVYPGDVNPEHDDFEPPKSSRRANPPTKPKSPHCYPSSLQPVLDGLAQYHPTGDSKRPPPPRVMHTPYSLSKHQGYGGPAQPHFFVYNFHPTPRDMKKWEGLWPFPEAEFEWLEGFLSLCVYMSVMKEEWTEGKSVGEYWREHVGEPR